MEKIPEMKDCDMKLDVVCPSLIRNPPASRAFADIGELAVSPDAVSNQAKRAFHRSCATGATRLLFWCTVIHGATEKAIGIMFDGGAIRAPGGPSERSCAGSISI